MIGPTPSAPLSSINTVSQATSLYTFNMNDVIALSHMKLALLSRDQRVDSALLLRSILIVNALETHQASQYSDERWLGQMPPSPNEAPAFVPAKPKLVPIAEEADDLIELLWLEPPVVSASAPISLGAPEAEVSHVEVVEVGDSDDEDESDDEYASMASSMHSIVSFSMDADDGAVCSPLSSPVQPTFELAFPSSPSAAYDVDGDFSDDDEDEVITPPQPVLLDDFKGDSDFGAYDADELEAVEGLQLFGAPSSRLP